MISLKEKQLIIKYVLIFVMGLNIVFWNASKNLYTKWPGVPPVPSKTGAMSMALGDKEFSFRFLSLMLQNFGEMGRETTPLKNYNYNKLREWFFLLHSLDPISNHVPMLAANYFGGTVVPEQSAQIIKYLSVAGKVPGYDKWRWLAHAAYLAQHRVYDMDLALDFAYELQRMSRKIDMPQWARQMPVFVLKHRGEKEASRKLMENLIISERAMHPTELNYMKLYLIEEFGVDEKYVEQLSRMRGEKIKD